MRGPLSTSILVAVAIVSPTAACIERRDVLAEKVKGRNFGFPIELGGRCA